MTEIYIVRHAEAEGNLFRRMCGWYNSPLTALGLKQVEKTAKRFENIHIDKVYSSDLKRTRQTSESITKSRGMTAILEPGLREICAGAWENLDFGTIVREYNRDFRNFTVDPANCHIDGGEDWDHLQRRMRATVLRLAAENDGKTIALFSHGNAIRALTADIMGLSSENVTQINFRGNTAVMHLFVDKGRFTLDYEGDCSHLGDDARHKSRPRFHVTNDGSDIMDLMMTHPENGDLAPFASCWDRDLPTAENNIDMIVARTSDGDDVGYAAMDMEKYADENAGLLKFFMILPDWRGKCAAAQLIGFAVARCRSDARRWLYAEVDIGSNEEGYLLHLGFTGAGKTADGKHLLRYLAELEPVADYYINDF